MRVHAYPHNHQGYLLHIYQPCASFGVSAVWLGVFETVAIVIKRENGNVNTHAGFELQDASFKPQGTS